MEGVADPTLLDGDSEDDESSTEFLSRDQLLSRVRMLKQRIHELEDGQ